MGEADQKFLFHRDMLSDMAPFFKAALESGFKEAEEALITMPEDTTSTIELFRLWAYGGIILDTNEDIEAVPWDHLIRLYIFADRYDLPDLQNAVMDAINTKVNDTSIIPTGYLHLIYDNTNTSSPLRRWIIDLSAQRGTVDTWFEPENSEDDLDKYPPLFMKNLAAEMYRLKEDKVRDHDWDELGCTFHVHPVTPVESKQELSFKR